jgi:septal ring factor EnvC (AmiA/AmiB activator)
MAEATEPHTVADGPPQCDQAGCSEPAVSSYTWDWGAKGVCCATHQMLLQQSSEHLQRRVTFAPLNLAPAPITRDERAKLKGEVYALEMECVDLKDRGAALYRENTTLTRQLQALTVRQRETEAQRDDARGELAKLAKSLEKSQAEQGEQFDELSRLRTLEKFVGDPGGQSLSSSHGLEGGQSPATLR